MDRHAFICGLSGPFLTAAEAKFLSATPPAGVILFGRNVQDPEQLRGLVSSVNNEAGADGKLLILVDQEGGRVQRLSKPHWPAYPPASAFGAMSARAGAEAKRAARLSAQLMARDLHSLGINTTCAPVLDVPVPGAD
ncbi:MAG: glycoside hydrolase family 3 N-terminal domain-containing protein, partial [Rhodomicrobium sp.]